MAWGASVIPQLPCGKGGSGKIQVWSEAGRPVPRRALYLKEVPLCQGLSADLGARLTSNSRAKKLIKGLPKRPKVCLARQTWVTSHYTTRDKSVAPPKRSEHKESRGGNTNFIFKLGELSMFLPVLLLYMT